MPTAFAAPRRLITNLRMRTKIALLLGAFGVAPALAVLGIYLAGMPMLRASALQPLAISAAQVGDTIDRNLFERYGDVQAFGLNAAVRDPANWRNPGPANPLVAAMNDYMTGYGIYRLMLALDPQGGVLAVNTVDADGRALDTRGLYGESFADASWFKAALAKDFLEGDGLTGTVVEQPSPTPLVAQLYDDDGLVITFAAPVRDVAGTVIAVWVNFADFGLVEDIAAEFHDGLVRQGLANAEVTILDPTGLILVDYDPARLVGGAYRRDPAVVGRLNLVDEGVEAAIAAVNGGSGAIDSLHARKQIVQGVGYAHTDGDAGYPGLGWSVLVRAPAAEIYSGILDVEVMMLVGILAAALVIAGLGLVCGSLIARPFVALSGAMAKLAQGDDDIDVPAAVRRDEVGRLWQAMGVLKTSVGEAFRLKAMVDEMPINVMLADPKDDFRISYINKTSVATLRTIEHLLPVKADQVKGQSVDIFHKNPSHQRRILADPSHLPHNATITVGDQKLSLKVSAIRDRQGHYVGPMVSWSVVTEQIRLAENVKTVVDTVASASAEMRASAESMTATAEETSRQATGVASASEQAASNVQTVAAAAEELAASISEIGRQVSQSTRIATDAVQQATVANERIKGLAEGSQKIGEVVRLISDIASQTNLLALNATIEAARAGEAGKGFAVVASEVKNLANQTAKATDEIATQVGAIQSAIGESVSVIEAIGGTIAEVNQISTAIAAAVEEQGSATAEISRNVQEAAKGTQEVSANITGVNQAAAETGQSASQVLTAAGELSLQASRLGKEIESFMTRLGAA